MSYFERTQILAADSPSIDAFDRLRVSEPYTVFDSKQLHDNSPLFWDEEITDVSGNADATHSTTNAAVTMTVDGNGDVVVRQTKMRFNYQPGKSQMILLTGKLTNTTNVKARIGAFSGDATATAPAGSNGVFFEVDSGTIYVVKRKNGSDTRVAQSSWNIDPFDGTGPSEVTIDPTKVQIGFIDFEWLGVGRIRMGFVIDGIIYYCHQFNHANTETAVYMSTPNLPLRYEISSSGGSSSLDHICSSVISEGGVENNGVVRAASTSGTHVDANTADTVYAVVGIQLKTTHLDTTIIPTDLQMLAETESNFEWLLMWNPTVAGTFTYSDETNSAIQSAKGATANTVTGGLLLASGWASSTKQGSSSASSSLDTPLRLGSAIDGTRDTLVLCVRPLSADADIQGSLTWRELS